MLIGIDSAKNMLYTGMVSGTYYEMEKFYNEITNTFSKNNVKSPFHWSDISRKVKDASRSEIIQLVNSSKLKFNILENRKPLGIEAKEYFLRYLPSKLAEHVTPYLKNFTGNVDIRIDDDFTVRNVKKSTSMFLTNFIAKISIEVVGERVAIFQRKDNLLRSTIKHDGKLVEFWAMITKAENSREIQIIDLILGYYLDDKNGFERERVHFRDISRYKK